MPPRSELGPWASIGAGVPYQMSLEGVELEPAPWVLPDGAGQERPAALCGAPGGPLLRLSMNGLRGPGRGDPRHRLRAGMLVARSASYQDR